MSAPAIAPSIVKLQQRVAEINRRRTDAEVPDVVPSSVRTAPEAQRTTLHFDVKIDGEVLHDALATTERGTGNAVVTVVLQQRLGALPVVAQRRYDDSAIAHMVAHGLAKRLRAGTSVHVTAKGLSLSDYDGHQALRLLDVQTIEPPLEPTTRKDLE